MASISLGLAHGAQGVKYSDFVQGTAAPSASTDVEVRWNLTDGNSNPVTREDVRLALCSIERQLAEGAVAPAGTGTVASPPPLLTSGI